MIVNINVITIGKMAQDIWFHMRTSWVKNKRNIFKTDYKHNSILNEHEENNYASYYWKEQGQEYIIKNIEKLLLWGDVNFIIVTHSMVDMFRQIVQTINYKKRIPIYVVIITEDNEDTNFRFRRWMKVKRFSQKGASSEDIFIKKSALQIDYIIEGLARNRCMSFDEFMQLNSVSKRGDAFDRYQDIYIPDFLLKIREKNTK